MAFTERYVTQAAGGGGSGTSGSPWTFAEAVTNHAAGDRINVKDDSVDYSLGATTLSVSSTDSSFVHWRGYATTIGDGGKPTLAMTGVLTVSANTIKLESLAFTMNATNDVITSTGSHNTFLDLDITNTSPTARAISLFTSNLLVGCRISTLNVTSARPAITSDSEALILNCTVKTSWTAISNPDYNIMSVEGCLLIGEGATAVAGIDAGDLSLGSGYGIQCVGNTIYNFDDGIVCDAGADATGSRGQNVVVNNVIYGVGYGFRNSAGTQNSKWLISNNAIGNATSARYSGLGDTVLHGDVTLTADPFTDSAANDFTINNTAGGGALLRGAGLSFPDPL